MGAIMDVFQKIANLNPGDSFRTTRDEELDLFFWRFPNGVWIERDCTLQQLAERHNLTIEEDMANDCFRIIRNG